MTLLEQYYEKFGLYPPKLKMVSYDDEIYQQLMKDAIEDDLPITNEDVEEAFANYSYDIAK